MKSVLIVAFSASALLITGCDLPNFFNPAAEVLRQRQLPGASFETIYSASFGISGTVEPVSSFVFRSQYDVAEFRRRNEVRSNEISSEIEQFNFKEFTYILVTTTPSPVGGVGAEVVRIEKLGESLIIHMVRWESSSGSIVTQSPNQPFTIVRLKNFNSATEIIFSEEIKAPRT